jgi:hypothetical protein
VTLDGDSFSSDSGLSNFLESGTYDVHDDGLVDLDIQSQQTDLKGYLSANKQYLVIRHPTAWAVDDIMLKVGLGIKQGGSYTAINMNGTYYFHDMEIYNAGNPDREASIVRGTLAVNAPAWSLTYTAFDSDGSSSTGGENGTFTMNPDGSFLLTPASGHPVGHGQLSSDFKVLFMVFGEQHPDSTIQNALAVGIKQSNHAYLLADLNGVYNFNELHIYNMEAIADDDRDGTVSWGDVAFDGAGNFTYAVSGFDADASTSSATGSGVYTVSTNGEVQFNVTEENGQPFQATFSGHLSDDGQILALTRAEHASSGGSGGSGDASGEEGGGAGCFIRSLKLDSAVW